ncbi:hypothetical protein MKW92_020042 [Papaver armeniacum]|nr:hypothetical protein MKW92_020042 [Papaver armeniacum]
MAAVLREKQLLFIGFFISFITVVLSARHHQQRKLYTPPTLKNLNDNFPRQTFDQAFSPYFGGSNLQVRDKGASVDISLNKYTGSGFISQNRYHYGFFSASIKFPAGDYSAGVVLAFYLSNQDVYPRSHDEIDFEFLGHAKRKPWNLQTNVYGNGSVKYHGREEKIRLWFDPTKQFHTYTIIWNSNHIVFLVDNIPIREVTYTKTISPAYPSKPMTLYSTIWDGSPWATDGGKYKVDYKLSPFVASFGKLQVEGCIWNNQTKSSLAPSPSPTLSPVQSPSPSPTPSSAPLFSCTKSGGNGKMDSVEGEDVIRLSEEQRKAMAEIRKEYLTYSYCKDKNRFPVLPPECISQ